MHSSWVKIENQQDVLREVSELPANVERARKSALSSTGNIIRDEIRQFIEGGGAGWKPLHPITYKFRKFKAPKSPLYYLGRFARYVVLDQDTSVEIGLGKGRATRPGGQSAGWSTFRGNESPWLDAAAVRAEEGQQVKVTRLIRLKWVSTKIKGMKWRKTNRSGAVTGGYFVLRPDTEYLTIPRRPIFGPVFQKIHSRIPRHFEAVFLEALERYRSGGKKDGSGASPRWRA